MHDIKFIHFQKNENTFGYYTELKCNKDMPFNLERVYFLYDIPAGESRGGHAHIILQQIIIAASGSFDLVIRDGIGQKKIQLNRPDFGIYLPSGLWRDLVNFSSNSVCLVLASTKYEEEDYIRDYSKFITWKLNSK